MLSSPARGRTWEGAKSYLGRKKPTTGGKEQRGVRAGIRGKFRVSNPAAERCGKFERSVSRHQSSGGGKVTVTETAGEETYSRERDGLVPTLLQPLKH